MHLSTIDRSTCAACGLACLAWLDGCSITILDATLEAPPPVGGPLTVRLFTMPISRRLHPRLPSGGGKEEAEQEGLSLFLGATVAELIIAHASTDIGNTVTVTTEGGPAWEQRPWSRSRRRSATCVISLQHQLASQFQFRSPRNGRAALALLHTIIPLNWPSRPEAIPPIPLPPRGPSMAAT